MDPTATDLDWVAAAWRWSDVLDMSGDHGWTQIGQGDWSWVLGDNSGHTALRVCPFDPAYNEYTDLAIAMRENPHTPEIVGVYDHPAGGYTVAMERLEPADTTLAVDFIAVLRMAEPGTDLGDLRRALESHSTDLALFVGYDDNPANVMVRPSDGTFVVVDGFWINGPELFTLVTDHPLQALDLYAASDLLEWANIPCMDPAATTRIREAVMSAQRMRSSAE